MKGFYIFLFVLFCAPLTAQVKFDNLGQCLSYIRQNNLSLKKEDLNYKISEEGVQLAWSSLLPQLKAISTFEDYLALPVQLVPAEFLGGKEGEFQSVQFGTQYNLSYGIEASLPLINTTAWKNVKSSNLRKESAHWQQIDFEQNILEQGVAVYYFALLSREAMGLNMDLAESNDSLLHVAEVRLNNGMIEMLEYNRIKAIQLESLQRRTETEATYQKNLNALKIICGLSPKDTIVLMERIGEVLQGNRQPEILRVEPVATPAYKMLLLEQERKEQELFKQRLRLLPELSFFARYTRQAQRAEFNFFSESDPWFDIGLIGIRAEWNLFTGLNRHSAIRQASLEKEKTRLDLENYEKQTLQELDDLENEHTIAARSVERFGEHYNLNRQNYKIAGRKYEEGIYSLDQYITIYQELVRSQSQYLNGLANFLVYDSMINLKNEFQVK